MARTFFLSPTGAKRWLGIVLCTAALVVEARPAPWYWWVSKLDGARICAQTSPGPGWSRERGPYPNGRCGADLPR